MISGGLEYPADSESRSAPLFPENDLSAKLKSGACKSGVPTRVGQFDRAV